MSLRFLVPVNQCLRQQFFSAILKVFLKRQFGSLGLVCACPGTCTDTV